MAGGRPQAKGPLILQTPEGGFRVRLSEGVVTDLGWRLEVKLGDIEFWCLVRRPGELWCAPASLRGPSGNHPMGQLIPAGRDTGRFPQGVVDDVAELPTPEEALRQTRVATFQATWASTRAQNQLLLKLNKALAHELDWVSTTEKKRRIALVPVGGILMLLSHDRYREARSESFEHWLDVE